MEEEAVDPILSPGARALKGARGVPVTLGDGATWLLAWGGLCNVLDELRDKLDDDARLSGQVQMADVFDAASALLLDNYDLGLGELAGLLAGAEKDTLAGAVMEAIFGPPHPRRTFTAWVSSALLANGIEPASIPGEMLNHVLAQIVATGRAISLDNFIDSAVAADQLGAIRARAGIGPKAAAPPAPEANAP